MEGKAIGKRLEARLCAVGIFQVSNTTPLLALLKAGSGALRILLKCNHAQRAPAFDSAEVRFAQDDSVFGGMRFKLANALAVDVGRASLSREFPIDRGLRPD